MGLFARVLPLVLGAALSPTALIAELLILSRPDHPVRSAAWFAVGFAIPLGALTASVLAAGHRIRADGGHHSTTSAVVDLVAAVLLLALATRSLLQARRHPSAVPARHRRGGHAGPLGCFVLGIVLMGLNFSTIVLYIPAMKEIAVSGDSDAVRAVVVVLAMLIALLPVLAPLTATALAPRASHRVLDPFGAFVTRHAATIGIVVSLVFAVYLGVKGFRAL